MNNTKFLSLPNDIGHSFESALDELGKKYGINP